MTMTARVLAFGVLAGLGFALCACASTPPERPKVNLAFEGKPKIAVPAARIEFADTYKPTLAAPHIEHDHDFRPSHLMRVWLNERLAPDPSAPGKLIVQISEASVIETGVPEEQTIGGAFKRTTNRELKGRLDWTVTYEGPDVKWKTSAYAESVRSVPEQASLNQVDKAYNDIIEALSGHLDERIEDQIESLRAARAEAAASPR